MAILGVLLGITIAVLGGVIWWARKKELYIKDLNHALTLVHDRVEILEKRKALLAEGVTPTNKTYMNSGQKFRTWSEDMQAADVKAKA